MHISITSRPLFHAPHPLRRLTAALALRRERRALLALDDHMLSDVGLTREEAVSEAKRLSWDAPAFWRHS
ncbi:MAG: DUF1127 domain-containing protein [bacterium]